ncbi:MAG: UDP-2,3-diacylglucosamine diphosphatase [Candidatus Schmidhempelia sp.]|nr:UDP-2,3-diacylglucosamine diphosphatase [Candidatus Schmidhempelia sp.]
MLRYFIADLHLNESEPEILTSFERFLQQLPDHCELYILGDLFDYWIGDDAITDLHISIANQIKSLTIRHIRIFFIAGNRDFLLGEDYAQQCGMTMLPDIDIITHQDKRIIIMHGDLLCTDDKGYQRLRRVLHCSWLQKLFSFLPIVIRNKIAVRMRDRSKQYNANKNLKMMDVNPQKVNELMIKYQADILIHGHTHRPTHIQSKLNGQVVERFVLGAWHDQADYVIADDNIVLISLR